MGVTSVEDNCGLSDISLFRGYAEKIGNSAHEVRNILAMTKKIELPELLAVDNLCAGVETVARQIIQTSQVPGNLMALDKGKLHLKSIYRANKFMLRNIQLDEEELGYQLLSAEHLKLLVEQINYQQILVKTLDQLMNEAFIGFLDKPTASSKQQVIAPSMSQDYNILMNQLDFKTLPVSLPKEPISLESLIQSVEQTCNKAHQIQNTICILQLVERVKQPANQLNNLAGNIENQMRAILLAFGQQSNNPNAVQKVIQNQTKAANEQITNILVHAKTLENEKFLEESKDVTNAAFALTEALAYLVEVANNKIITLLQ